MQHYRSVNWVWVKDNYPKSFEAFKDFVGEVDVYEHKKGIGWLMEFKNEAFDYTSDWRYDDRNLYHFFDHHEITLYIVPYITQFEPSRWFPVVNGVPHDEIKHAERSEADTAAFYNGFSLLENKLNGKI